MQLNFTAQRPTDSPNSHSQNQADVSVSILIGFCIIIPLILFTSFKFYKKHRAAVLRQQVATLEKIWHLNLKKRA